MHYTLENEFLKATFKTLGAELISLKSKKGIEYIWNGDAKHWGRHTPVLFPIVGGLKDNTYYVNQQAYKMKQHGFARNSEFTVVKETENTLVFELASSKATLQYYPFDFTLQITYTLSNQGIKTHYSVKNPSDCKLLFSIGAHPAYACPFEAEQNREDYILIFDNDATPVSQQLTANGRSTKNFGVFKQGGILDLPNTIFDKDALIFNPNPFSEVSFVHQPTGKTYMSVTFKNFPYLGIWSANQEAPFICIEPWHGIADAEDHNQQLEDKEGILTLAPKEEFMCEYFVTIGA
ncbi:aldose 1-epimerase family protein [Ochrovirga pacifica]|uniref:aldose 1-epimerase family protein n=1 Tax=Ochrovirga pacifica TaxID=1042376 RepID=UPI000255A4CB|nr:aldose 1-epimerase family protein [Ochrovirga pacifica]